MPCKPRHTFALYPTPLPPPFHATTVTFIQNPPNTTNTTDTTKPTQIFQLLTHPFPSLFSSLLSSLPFAVPNTRRRCCARTRMPNSRPQPRCVSTRFASLARASSTRSASECNQGEKTRVSSFLSFCSLCLLFALTNGAETHGFHDGIVDVVWRAVSSGRHRGSERLIFFLLSSYSFVRSLLNRGNCRVSGCGRARLVMVMMVLLF